MIILDFKKTRERYEAEFDKKYSESRYGNKPLMRSVGWQLYQAACDVECNVAIDAFADRLLTIAQDYQGEITFDLPDIVNKLREELKGK